MDISILIVSNLAQRRDWLVERLIFLGKAGYTGEVILGVWGGHEQIPVVAEICSSYLANARFRIVSQNGDVFMHERIMELAQHAASSYVVTQGDDDFLIPSGLVKPLELLAADPNVLCAQGRCITLSLDEFPGQLISQHYPLWEALEDDALERFSNLMKHYSFTFYSVYRKHQFLERSRYMLDVHAHAQDFVFFEAMGDLYSVINGKIVIFNELFIVRGEHAKNESKTLQGMNYKMAPYLLLSPEFSRTYKYFEGKCLELFKSKGIDPANEAVMRQILDGMMNFMGRLFYKLRDSYDAGQLEFIKKTAEPGNDARFAIFQLIYKSHAVGKALLARIDARNFAEKVAP